MADDRITLAHGAGGAAMHDLIEQLFAKKLSNPILNHLDDSAVVELNGSRLAFTSDSFVVDPLFFPGGDIGRLAVCGTINDLVCAGARPLYLSSSFILEDGLEMDILERVVDSVRVAADEAGVVVATGDTKVVAKGAADRMFINTSGIGIIEGSQRLSCSNARPGDVIILSGRIAEHGMAVMSRREGLQFECEIKSDVAPLTALAKAVVDACPDVRGMRDPTRGGAASVLIEIASQSRVCIEVEEQVVPVSDSVRAACELLGIDPLHVANEGKLIVIAAPDSADAALAAMRNNPLGREAVRIGTVTGGPPGRVHLLTPYGARRILILPHGELLPRIC